MSEFGSKFNQEPEYPLEGQEQDQERSRLEQALHKYQISLPNLDELFQNGLSNLEVVANGQPVKFDQFTVALEESMAGQPTTAEVVFIEKSNKQEYQGIGLPLYIKLGQELLSRGILLTASTVQYGPGRDLWLKLAKLGYAEKSGAGFRFKERTSIPM